MVSIVGEASIQNRCIQRMRLGAGVEQPGRGLRRPARLLRHVQQRRLRDHAAGQRGRDRDPDRLRLAFRTLAAMAQARGVEGRLEVRTARVGSGNVSVTFRRTAGCG